MTALMEPPAKVFGSETPRLSTPPLRDLADPANTLGYSFIAFASMCRVQLTPWQCWLAVHALETNPDGSLRYKTILVLVGRQCGKTTFAKLLTLFFMYVRRSKLCVGAAQSLDIAMEAFTGAVAVAQDVPALSREVASVRLANGQQCLTHNSGGRYKITAMSAGAGRGLSVDGVLLLDELRMQRDWASWSALSKTTLAAGGLIFAISNAGDLNSVVLNELREKALAGTNDSFGLFEWSAPDGCELDDPNAWAQGCPGLGYTVDEDAVRMALATDPPATFRTEILCQNVDVLNVAINPHAWAANADATGSLAPYADRIVAGFEVGIDGEHCSLLFAAKQTDGRVRLEAAGSWPTTEAARNDLRGLLDRYKPTALAWSPTGPAAALAPVLRSYNGSQEIKGTAVAEACMGLADLVTARQVLHSNDPLLNTQIAATGKLPKGDGWVFSRRGHGNSDAAYAAAFAVHAALNAPEPRPHFPKLVI